MKTLFALALSVSLFASVAPAAMAAEGFAPDQGQTTGGYLPRVPGLPRVPNIINTCVAQNANGVTFPAVGLQGRRFLARDAMRACRLGSFGVPCRMLYCR